MPNWGQHDHWPGWVSISAVPLLKIVGCFELHPHLHRCYLYHLCLRYLSCASPRSNTPSSAISTLRASNSGRLERWISPNVQPTLTRPAPRPMGP